MDLGWLDVCLRVQSVVASREFYERLGFARVEGEDSEGWAVVVNAEARIGLFESRFMGDDVISLNFRGGRVAEIMETLREAGVEFDKACVRPDGSGSAELRDPDGYLIFLDAGAGEVKKG